jgi:hypothetical protein
MTTPRQRHAIGLLAFGLLSVLPMAAGAEERPATIEKLAKTYGLDSFNEVEAIRYTFNLEAPGHDASRSWIWEPKTDQVTYEGKDKSGKPVKVTYARSDPGANAEVDANFVNDQYWLLLPFHIYWDASADAQDAGPQKLPLGTGTADQVVVKYPSDGGYSPGDTWELFLGSTGRIEEMVYRQGAGKLTVLATWADYKKAGPLLFSLEHRGQANGGPLHLYFSNVAVKRAGSDDWIAAK